MPYPFANNFVVTYHTSDEFIRMLKEHADSPATNIVLRNEIKAVFVDEGDACVIYDLRVSLKTCLSPKKHDSR